MNSNHHISKFVRIGQVQADGLFNIISETNTAIAPISWNRYVPATTDYTCDWSKVDVTAPDTPGKFRILTR
jgi:urea transport system substrate-binding protein